MLLIVCSAFTIASAQSKANKTTPVNVQRQLDTMIELFGKKDDQVYSVIKNPNTNQIESSEKITHFVARTSGITPFLSDVSAIGKAFMQDEPVCYQILHLVPGSTDYFKVQIVNNDPLKKNYLNIRTNKNQEMWYMATKNPTNPQLRDIYAITWETMDNKTIEGDIFMVSSLRPDIYQQNMENSRKTFKIEGRVDGEIKDSLYNIYIADSYEDLNALGDDDYVACVPVINKRFEYSVELDEPKAGRLRCIFPDGSLCSAWINVDFVPGETYRITVHNGYYDEDRDYENRVGRWSGKSLVVGHDNDDVAVEGLSKNAAVKDTILPGEISPTIIQNMMTEQMISPEEFKTRFNTIEKLFGVFKENFYSGPGRVPGYSVKVNFIPGKSRLKADDIFKEIGKNNKALDKASEKQLKTFQSNKNLEPFAGMFIAIIVDFYSMQNKALNDIIKQKGYLSKEGVKCQKNVTKYIDKYAKTLTGRENWEKYFILTE